MQTQPTPWHGRRFAGVLLILAGVAFLLDQSGIVAVQDLWHYWPLALVAAGIVRVAGSATARDTIGGAWSILIGLWLFANFEGWFGMNFDNSWPFLLIAWGVTLLFSPAVTGRRARRRNRTLKENQERHHAL